jgi:hypothetical protein
VAQQKRPAEHRRCPVQVGTVPALALTRRVASNVSTGQTPGDHAQGTGAARDRAHCELADQCPLSPGVEKVPQVGSSREPNPSTTTTRFYDGATGTRRHAVAKAVPSRPFSGVWLEGLLHLCLVSISTGDARLGSLPTRQWAGEAVQSTRLDPPLHLARENTGPPDGTDRPGQFSARSGLEPSGTPEACAVPALYDADTPLRARPAVHTCGCWCGELLDRRASSW